MGEVLHGAVDQDDVIQVTVRGAEVRRVQEEVRGQGRGVARPLQEPLGVPGGGGGGVFNSYLVWT